MRLIFFYGFPCVQISDLTPHCWRFSESRRWRCPRTQSWQRQKRKSSSTDIGLVDPHHRHQYFMMTSSVMERIMKETGETWRYVFVGFSFPSTSSVFRRSVIHDKRYWFIVPYFDLSKCWNYQNPIVLFYRRWRYPVDRVRVSQAPPFPLASIPETRHQTLIHYPISRTSPPWLPFQYWNSPGAHCPRVISRTHE